MDIFTYWNTWVASFLRSRFGRSERGASLVEYVLLVALIAVVCIVAIQFLGTSASTKFSSVGSSVGG
ncbi:MAG TPA: Flp family type IVb pilin [Acidimicrobiales bacterium]|nr:Flp family type IVb pilin [Acidimicrobiales bacterium]